MKCLTHGLKEKGSRARGENLAGRRPGRAAARQGSDSTRRLPRRKQLPLPPPLRAPQAPRHMHKVP